LLNVTRDALEQCASDTLPIVSFSLSHRAWKGLFELNPELLEGQRVLKTSSKMRVSKMRDRDKHTHTHTQTQTHTQFNAYGRRLTMVLQHTRTAVSTNEAFHNRTDCESLCNRLRNNESSTSRACGMVDNCESNAVML
jgi:hypothetical protein